MWRSSSETKGTLEMWGKDVERTSRLVGGLGQGKKKKTHARRVTRRGACESGEEKWQKREIWQGKKGKTYRTLRESKGLTKRLEKTSHETRNSGLELVLSCLSKRQPSFAKGHFSNREGGG